MENSANHTTTEAQLMSNAKLNLALVGLIVILIGALILMVVYLKTSD
jgi:hypothetical protein